MKKLKLNLGSGDIRIPGFINVDNNPNLKNVDIVHDLNRFPWPFEDNSVTEIIADHIIEHLNDTISVILEFYRICADNAYIYLTAPHFSCNWTHPAHKRAIGIGLFDHFDRFHKEHYGNCNFHVEKVRLHWIRPRYLDSFYKKLFSQIISFFANINIQFCQRFWCYWVGGFEEVEFTVRVKK